jgi:hypothetical protein
MKNINAKIIIALVVTAIIVGGCTRPDRTQVRPERMFLGLISKDQFKPRAYRDQTFDHVPFPERTPQGDYDGEQLSYERGFQDGCQTASSAIGEGLYRLRGPKIDADQLSTDPMYLRGFQDAANYCTSMVDWETH